MAISSPTFTIIADDLTGACDAIAPFAAAGRPVHVRLEPPAQPRQQHEFVAYSTDTRRGDFNRAVQKVERFATPLANAGLPLMKKIDSTLLGHIVVETSVIQCKLGDAAALIAPAFPAMGRCIEGGELYVAGQPAGRSVPALIREQTGAFCHTLSLGLVRAGADALGAAIEDQWRRGCRWFSVDARRDEDLATVAGVLAVSPLNLLPVGSGGLSRALSRLPALAPPPSQTPTSAQARRGPVVVFAGSSNLRTELQLGRVTDVCREAGVDAFITGVDQVDNIDAIVASLGGNGVVVVRVAWGDYCRDRLAAIVQSCAGADVRGVILTGGDTASLICRLAGCTHLLIEGEVHPGVPFGKFADGLLVETPLVTKAGGFGAEDALVAACRHFEARSSAAGNVFSSRRSGAPAHN